MTDKENRIEQLFSELNLRLTFLMANRMAKGEVRLIKKPTRKTLRLMCNQFGIKMRWYHLSYFFRKKLTNVIKGIR